MKVSIPYFQINPQKKESKKEERLLILSIVLSLILILMPSLRSAHCFDMSEMTLNISLFNLAFQELVVMQLLNILMLSAVIFILVESVYYLFNIFRKHVYTMIPMFNFFSLIAGFLWVIIIVILNDITYSEHFKLTFVPYLLCLLQFIQFELIFNIKKQKV